MQFILNESIVKDVLGQKSITIRELTIKESLNLQTLPEEEVMFAMLAKSIVKPKISINELEGMPARYMNDLVKITDVLNAVEPNGSK